eukprot:TRINITY_DN43671_c0_g1_i1.p1 TRINITY_DN43671_c0_g1~~TRINITY_DN43671_c0_g1_i1.p1  ORF type:complete len:491 (+),score=140.34 TRINITY_DN43671_c0_g1_i1:59-1474(+)
MANPCGMPPLRAVGAEVSSMLGSAVRRVASVCSSSVERVRERWEEGRALDQILQREVTRRQQLAMNGLPWTYREGIQDEAVVRAMPHSPLLGTDMLTSAVSFGGSGVGGSYINVERGAAVDAVREAFRLGINFFDTAPLYGLNREGERIIADGLQGVPRECYYLSTKVGRYVEEKPDGVRGTRIVPVHDYGYHTVIDSVKRSLEALQTDYLDIVWIHDPHYCSSYTQIRNSTMLALAQLRQEGLVRHFGLAGYDMTVMHYLVRTLGQQQLSGTRNEHVMLPQVVQVVSRYNLLDRSLLSLNAYPQRLAEYLKNHGIGVVSAAPMAMGLLSPRSPPRWHPAPKEAKDACREVVRYCADRGVCATRICLYYALQQMDIIGSHLTGLSTAAEVRSAVDVATNMRLTEAEAGCLNWARKRLEDVNNTSFVEPAAMFSTDGFKSNQAAGAPGVTVGEGREQAARQGFVRGQGGGWR